MPLISVKLKSYLKTTKLGTYLRRKRWNNGILNKTSIAKRVDKYLPERTEAEKQLIIDDIIDMAKKYRFSADEYFYYHFENKSEDERKKFISDLNRIDFCESLNQSKNLHIFDDKMKSAEVFGKYYGRDVCSVKSIKDFERFKEFIKKHNKFIVKPLTGTCGKGIKIVSLSENDKNEICALINEYSGRMQDGLIAEQIIVQDPSMAQFHPSSINTVRVATVKYDEGVEVIASFFRMGRSGSIVDNAGAGGIFGTIDIEAGTVIAVADELGNDYTNHPDTGAQIVGFVIPHWEEAKTLAKELATVVKGNRYAGWDLALTEHGWIMVEGNARGQFVWQIPTQKGFLDEAKAILNRLGIKEKKLSI
jgi:hypothetical protein